MLRQTMALGLGFALVLGGFAASAQQPMPPRQGQGNGAWQGRRHPGLRMLLHGITLTADQKTQLKAMRDRDSAQLRTEREGFKKSMDGIRALQQRGDTAAARTAFQALRTQMMAFREKRAAAIRAVLTPEQQQQFDANLAKLKAHAEKVRAWKAGGRGEHDGSAHS